MKKIIICILILFPSINLYASSVKVAALFSKSGIFNYNINSTYNIKEWLLIGLDINIFKNADSWGKDITPSIYFNMPYEIFIGGSYNYMPALNNYSKKGFNINIGKSFGSKYIITPVFNYGKINYRMTVELIDKDVNLRFNEESLNPAISFNINKIIEFSFSYQKNNYSVSDGEQTMSMTQVIQKYPALKQFVYYDSNLYNTVNNFIDKSISFILAKDLSENLSCSLIYIRSSYLYKLEGRNSKIDNILIVNNQYFIYEAWAANLTIATSLSEFSMDNTSLQIGLEYFY